jgi:hypothetical protein
MFQVTVPSLGRFAGAVVTAAVLVVLAAPAAMADQRDCKVLHNVLVCVAVHSPSVTTPSPGPSPLGVSPGTCSWQGRKYPCHDLVFGWFANSDGCYYEILTPQPAYDSTLWEGHPYGQGTIYQFMCPTRTGSAGGWRWRATSPQPAAVAPAQLARQAFASLKLPRPVPPMSPSGATLPDGRPYTVVQVPTWYWTTPASYQPKTARAAVGPVWAQVTVTPVALTFTPGDSGSTVSCAGPGKVWTAQVGPWTNSPGGCDYSYPQSTYGYPGGQLTATYGIVWRATWTGSGGSGGAFPDVSTTATARFAVAEAQAVIVR